MQYAITLKNSLVIGACILAFSACKKAATTEPLADKGQTIVKFMGGPADTASGYASGYKLVNIDLISTPQTFELLDLRRDAANNTDLNKTMNVIIKNDPGLVSAYDPALTPLPDGAFGSADPAVPLVGQDYQVTFKPGEFAKVLKIVINNVLLLDLSKTYGIGFTISSVDADGHIAALEKSIVIEFGLKNRWDGIYSYQSGLVTRYSAPGVPLNDAFSGPLGPANPDVILSTLSENAVQIPPSSIPKGRLTWSGGNSGVAGIDGVKITIDPATNLTTAISSGYPTSNATFGNWAGHVNRYDPVTKTFYFAFRWNPTANVREYEVVFKYKGPR